MMFSTPNAHGTFALPPRAGEGNGMGESAESGFGEGAMMAFMRLSDAPPPQPLPRKRGRGSIRGS